MDKKRKYLIYFVYLIIFLPVIIFSIVGTAMLPVILYSLISEFNLSLMLLITCLIMGLIGLANVMFVVDDIVGVSNSYSTSSQKRLGILSGMIGLSVALIVLDLISSYFIIWLLTMLAALSLIIMSFIYPSLIFGKSKDTSDI